MNLYPRDFSKPISDEERNALEEELRWNNQTCIKNTATAPRFAHPSENIRDFLWHTRSLFPNNHLNPITIREMDLETEAANYTAALDAAANETAIQNYIKQNRKWFIPASLLLDYNFGHHDAYLFPEQSLGNEYRVDYILLGKNSDGFSMVLIEFEDVNVDYKISSMNSESLSVRKGLTQIRDWKRWMDNSKLYFFDSLGLLKKGIAIPTSRIYYALVVSRREKMTDICRELRSQAMYETPNLKIISYDRLANNITRLSHGY